MQTIKVTSYNILPRKDKRIGNKKEKIARIKGSK